MAFDTVGAQTRLKARRAPYWSRLGIGQHVGVRKAEDGSIIWQAKSYDPATRKESYKSLGDFAHLPANERYSAAVKAAAAWFEHVGKGGRSEEITVGKACARYVKHLRARKGDQPAADAAGRFARHVDGDPIASIALSKLTARHVDQWRERLEKKPAAMPKRGAKCRVKSPQPTRPRSASANNRDMVALRAALNLALHDGYATTDGAWRTKLEPVANAGSRRTLYLSRDQRRALIASLPEDCAAFVSGLAMLPLRPGALASLTVADYNSRAGSLRIGVDKAGTGRTILLPTAIGDLIGKQAMGKLPGAPLFARVDGRQWSRDAWKGPIKKAAAAIGLPAGTVAYTLRHSAITDLIAPRDEAGKEAQGLDLFTVAALSGTSVAMVEKHYGHLQQTRARDALAGLAL